MLTGAFQYNVIILVSAPIAKHPKMLTHNIFKGMLRNDSGNTLLKPTRHEAPIAPPSATHK